MLSVFRTRIRTGELMPEPSANSSNFRQAIEAELVCCACGAQNRPGVSYVTVDLRAGTAECSVCARGGPLARFQIMRRAEEGHPNERSG